MRRLRRYVLCCRVVLLSVILVTWKWVLGFGLAEDNVEIHVNRGLVGLIAGIQTDWAVVKAVLDAIVTKGPAGYGAGSPMAVTAVCPVGAALVRQRSCRIGWVLQHTGEEFIMNTPILGWVNLYAEQAVTFDPTTERALRFAVSHAPGACDSQSSHSKDSRGHQEHKVFRQHI